MTDTFFNIFMRSVVSIAVLIILYTLYDIGTSLSGAEELLAQGVFSGLISAVFFLSRKLAGLGYIFKAVDLFCSKFSVVGPNFHSIFYGWLFLLAALWKFADGVVQWLSHC